MWLCQETFKATRSMRVWQPINDLVRLGCYQREEIAKKKIRKERKEGVTQGNVDSDILGEMNFLSPSYGLTWLLYIL